MWDIFTVIKKKGIMWITNTSWNEKNQEKLCETKQKNRNYDNKNRNGKYNKRRWIKKSWESSVSCVAK